MRAPTSEALNAPNAVCTALMTLHPLMQGFATEDKETMGWYLNRTGQHEGPLKKLSWCT